LVLLFHIPREAGRKRERSEILIAFSYLYLFIFFKERI